MLAELLSDRNNIPFTFVKFKGINKAAISERNDYGYGCILTTYDKIKNRLQAENISVSDTTVRPRKDVCLFDYDCVNGAVLNALVHNDWTITEPQISMFQDRIEILSHGGLPSGMTKKQFFDGISKPRNVTLMRIFLNMGLTEHTGHGIPMIVEKYGMEAFEIESNYIRCIIHFNKEVLDQIGNQNAAFVSESVSQYVVLSKTEKKVIGLLIRKPSIKSAELAETIGVTKRTIERSLKNLQEKKMIERLGSKRDGNWIVIR